MLARTGANLLRLMATVFAAEAIATSPRSPVGPTIYLVYILGMEQDLHDCFDYGGPAGY